MKQNQPARGERRAASGYGGQYRVAAKIIYRALRRDILIWIGVADIEAGRVDDLQIGSPGRVDAYQVKWSQFPGAFTFNDLVSASPKSKGGLENPCLIAQLADGWAKLRARYPSQRVVVHLITNDFPSRNDSPPTSDPPPTPRHFAAFLAQAWNPTRSEKGDELTSLPAAWLPTWASLQGASGLDAVEFVHFARDLEIDFAFASSESDADSIDYFAQESKDRAAIEAFLFQTVGDPENITTVSRDDLVARLGWGDRFHPRSRHEFPPPAFSYEPIGATQKELLEKLDSLAGGYLAVLGPPGSGKSTLLTETLRTRTDRVIRYYAFVPDSFEPDRGEARNFLHDVVIALERAGFRAGASIPGGERLELAQRFHRQVELLHNDYATRGTKTILVVDGLDHIDREQHPERSLLCDLPSPDRVPEGVILLLGSQTAQLPDLPPAVERTLGDPERRIEMRPLSREAVIRLVERTGFRAPPSREQLERFLDLVDGHPLSTEYLLNRIVQAESMEVIDDILADEVEFGGNIQRQYHAFWIRYVKGAPEFGRLLGLLSCLRGAVDMGWVSSWSPPEPMRLLRERAAHYFRREQGRWYIYHNSFRQFLLCISGGEPDQSNRDCLRGFHSELAERFSAAPRPDLRWEELHHRIQAGEFETALRIASQEHFRQQFLQLRTPSAIRGDIEQALRIATQRRDIVALGRLLLAFTECGDRESYLDHLPLTSLLLDADAIETAILRARTGRRLHLGRPQGLALARTLAERGFREEASRLFELAEPLDSLNSGSELEYEGRWDEPDVLSKWAATATFFRPVGEVIATICRLRFVPRSLHQEDGESWTRRCHDRLLFSAGVVLVEQGRWVEFDRYLEILSASNAPHKEVSRWLRVRSIEALGAEGEIARAHAMLDELITEAERSTEQLDENLRLTLAEHLLKTSGDDTRARSLAGTFEVPDVQRLSINSRSDWEELRRIFRIARLRFCFGDTRSIGDIIPTPDDVRLLPTALVVRDIVRMAKLAASVRDGRLPSENELQMELRAVLGRFSVDWRSGHDRHDWFPLLSLRERIYSLVIQTVGRLGVQQLDRLRLMFEAEWASPRSSKHWHNDLKRSIILDLGRTGVHRSWVVAELERIERGMLDGIDVNDRVTACKAQIEAYLEVGEKQRARALIDRVVANAIGVGGRKDYQFDHWLDWLDRVLDLEPEKFNDRVLWHARAVVSLRETTEGGYRSASLRLVEIVSKRDLRAAVCLMHWFHRHEVLSHDDALVAILRQSLARPQAPVDLVFSLTTFVLIPMTFGTEPDLLRELMTALRYRGRSEAIEGARTLVRQAECFAPRSARSGWFRAMREALNAIGVERWVVAIPEHEPAKQVDPPSGQILVKRDGTKQSRDEVLAAITSVDDLLVLLKAEARDDRGGAETSSFDWSSAIKKVGPSITAGRIGEIASALRGQWRDTFALIELARRSLALGDRGLARSLAEEAVERSSPHGWDLAYDGGSRFEAFRCLCEVEPNAGRESACRRFLEDFQPENFYRGRFLFNLDGLADLMLGEVPILPLYSEVERHVHALFEGAALPDDAPDLCILGLQETGQPEAALFDLIEFYLVHPAPWIMQSAWRYIGHLIRRGDETAERLTKRLIASGAATQEGIAPVLEAAALESPALIERCRSELMSLGRSSHGGLRCVARRIARRMRWEVPDFEAPTMVSPPPIYNLALPPLNPEDWADIEEYLSGLSLRADDNPVTMLIAHLGNLEKAAHITGIPLANLVERAAQIMNDLDPSRGWTDEAEARVRTRLENMGPRFTYRRPRFLAGRRACHHLLAELEDLGLVDEQGLASLCFVFRWFDPSLILRMPSVRPSCITSMGEERIVYHSRWIAEIEDAFLNLASRFADGWVVLAESTSLARPIHEDNREYRESQIVLNERRAAPDDGQFFETINVGTLGRYGFYERRSDPPPLVLRNDPYDLGGLGSAWLALNPWVGVELGWTRANDGLFRWVDGAGRAMIETIHWIDGPIDLGPYQDVEVGEGFLVAVHPEGIRAILKRWGGLTRISRVRRRYRDGRLEHDEARTKTAPCTERFD